MESQNKIRFAETIKRFVRFGFVGASGVVVDMGVLFLLADPRTLGWGLSLSKTLAAEVAIINNFIWNDLWTFRDLVVDTASVSPSPPRGMVVESGSASKLTPLPFGRGEGEDSACASVALTAPDNSKCSAGAPNTAREARALPIPFGWRARLVRFTKFNLICLAGIVFSVLLLNAQVRMLHFNVYVANFIAKRIWQF